MITVLTTGNAYLSKQEVCKALDISLSTLNRLIAANQIPFKKLSRFTGPGYKIIFDRKTIDAWVSSRIKPGKN